ncbi:MULTISPECIES: VOC family protein [Streptomyces]|uniref:VOC family protein n=1 Tax=Streptomyces TaxID=1883 RepID=UPI0003C2F0B1|nr:MULTISPECIES: VOC family protein [unclassified Streptomyces]ESP99227.1 Glyoxalase/bleomycin resistance protein/dioxygenase [Streptomyces sp. GBA 94-10 4N24]ESQ05039.1 Glyoxalase/bleomycin resistance protein/dioxygenase [Streptomyces sp. PVA_94-07]UZN59735.1 Glyoxalase/bleomycin resistance protein/dioxygenase [Streptomyces sp. GBA 94-10 4N24]WSB21713.1 VOC family protein [Streptomyces albidoflavus]
MPAAETVPAAYLHSVVPHLLVDDADAALAFYERAFGAEPRFRLDGDEGEVVHAELTVAGAVMMLGDAGDDLRSPAAIGGTPVILHVYVPDVDALTARATAAGAELLEGPADQFHGDRTAMLRDPFGHLWIFLTHLEDLTPEQIAERLAEANGPAGATG